jgi:hypothetical protein
MVLCVVWDCVTFQSAAVSRKPFIRKYLPLLQNKFLEQMIYTAVVDGRVRYLSLMRCRRVSIATDILGLHRACHSLRIYSCVIYGISTNTPPLPSESQCWTSGTGIASIALFLCSCYLLILFWVGMKFGLSLWQKSAEWGFAWQRNVLGRSNGKGKGVPVYAMKEYGVMEVELICSLGASWVGRFASRHGLFTRGKISVTHYTGGLCVEGGHQSGRFWEVITLLLLPRIERCLSGIQP